MSVSIVTAQAVDQTLRITSTPPTLASGGENDIRIDITFDSSWAGYGKTAVFYRAEGKVAKTYHVTMTDDTCLMPYEVMTEPGRVLFGITGINGTVVKTTEVVALTLKQGSICIGKVPEPLPDIYKQLLTAYGSMSAAINAERAERKAEVAVERARIDNLLADGSTEDDELLDIRVGYDGTTYDCAGAAVRAVGAELGAAKYNAVRPNLIDINKTEFGYYSAAGVWQSGYSNLETTSDYIDVAAGEPYTLSMEYPSTEMFKTAYVAGEQVPGSWARILFYDADKAVLSSTDYSFTESRGVYTVTAPDSACFVRVSWRHYFTPMQIKLEPGEYPTAIQPTASAGLVHEGYYTTDGAVATDNDTATYTTKRAMPVEVEPGAEYTVYNIGEYSGQRWAAIAFFDAAGNIVERITYATVAGNDVRQITVPDNAVCAGLTARVDHLTAFAMYKTVAECEKTLEQRYLDLYLAQLETPSTAVGIIKAVAHRGYSAGAPENTLPAYKLASKNGFPYAECDVSFTADGVAVLLHDSTVDRTSDGTGDIASLTLEEVRALDFGSWYGDAYAGTVIPTFDEFLDLCQTNGLRPYIELKAGTTEQITGLVEAVKQHGLQHKATWISFSAGYLQHVRSVDSRARLGYVVGAVTDTVITTARGLLTDTNEVFIDSASYTDAEVDLCVEAGLPLEVWTINSATTIRNLPAYVSGVTSDSQHAGRVLCSSSAGEASQAGAIETEASGDVVTVTDAAARDALAVVSTITAAQEGEGDPSLDNIRPLRARDAVSLYHGAAYDEGAEEGLFAALPEAIYGGTLDWVTGVLTVTHKLVTYTGSNVYWAQGSNSFYLDISDCAEGATLLSNRFVQNKASYGTNLAEGEMGVGSKYYRICFGNPSNTMTQAEWVAQCDAYPVELVYEMTEHSTVQLDAQTLAMFKGNNALWSDTGSTSVAYIADTKLYIDGRIAALTAAAASEV